MLVSHWGIEAEEGKRTGIGDGNGRSIDIAKVVSDRRNNWHGDGACCADNDGPEEGGTLAGCPAAVLEGSLPEERSGRHDGLYQLAQKITIAYRE